MGGGGEAVLGEMRKEPLQSSGLQNGAPHCNVANGTEANETEANGTKTKNEKIW